MKKFMLVLALAFVFAGASNVYADEVKCGELDPVTNVVRSCGNGNPELVVNGYGVMNSQVPHVKPGQSYVGVDGFTIIDCPIWFGNGMYCLDVTVTDIWKNQMRSTAKQLQGNGWLSSFPKFVYWLNH